MMRRDGGFTIVEVLVAALVLTLAVIAMIGALDASRVLTTVGERHTLMAHRAQRELERVAALPYAQVAMTAAPSPSTDRQNPNYYVAAGPPATFQWDRNTASTAEPFAIDSAGAFTPSTEAAAQPCPAATNPCKWTDGLQSGYVYDFVTWHYDSVCNNGSVCPAQNDYKRVTVVVTLTGASHPSMPALVSTLVSDTHAQPAGYVANGVQNPLQAPSTQCQNAQGVQAPCANALPGNAQTWFLHDTDATTSTARQAITGDHPTHPVLAPTDPLCSTAGIGCPKPDLMGPTPPPTPTTPPAIPPPKNYSNEITGVTYAGGKLLHRDTACATAPSTTDNTKGAVWVSNQLTANTVLTGDGGMTLHTQTANGVSATVALCIAIYDYPPNILNLVQAPPVQLGVVAYTSAQAPTAPTPLSFSFNFLGTGVTKTVLTGHRIGVRVWVAASAASDAALIYDHPKYASALQLNTQ
jgi:hypothetical protein